MSRTGDVLQREQRWPRLELILHDANSIPDQPPSTLADQSETFRDTQGRICLTARSSGDHYWLDVVGVGTFGFTLETPLVEAYPAAGVPQRKIRDTFRRIVLPLALHVRGFEVLHASAVLGPHGVVGICAVSGTGKSTLAGALHRQGYALWADDALALEIVPDGIFTRRLPATLRLANDAFRAIHELNAPSAANAPRQPLHLPRSAKLVALVVLERSTATRPASLTTHHLERLAPAEAFRALLPHAYALTQAPRQQQQRLVERYLELVTRIPVHHLTLPSGLDHLPTTLQELRREILEP